MEGMMISELSENIIHHILSYLKTEEAARVSPFCKAWHRAWLECPTLNFGGDFRYPTDRFFRVLENTFRRYGDQTIPIEQLILELPVTNDSSSIPIVNECIRIAIENGVRKLELDFCVQYAYTLPRIILEAKTLLRELTVYGLDGNVKLTGVGDQITLKYLRKLNLSSVHIDDNLFQHIIRRCSLIDDLCIDHCYGLERIKVTNVVNLKKFIVFTGADNEAIEIDAPNLEYLGCANELKSIDFYTTRRLKYMYLSGNLPSVTFFDNFMHKFPQLEDLTWDVWDGPERINISSHSLKRITLEAGRPGHSLKELKIDAPSLVSLSLNLDNGFILALSLDNAPSHQWVSKIWFGPDNTFEEFCKLKEYLPKLVQSKISLALDLGAELKFDHAGHDLSCPMAIEVEDIYLSNFGRAKGLVMDPNFLDSLFQICHPRVIEANQDDEVTCKFLYENLIERRRNHEFHDCKSWYKDLKEVRFEVYNKTTKEWLLRDSEGILKDMLGKDRRKAFPNWIQLWFRLDWTREG